EARGGNGVDVKVRIRLLRPGDRPGRGFFGSATVGQRNRPAGFHREQEWVERAQSLCHFKRWQRRVIQTCVYADKAASVMALRVVRIYEQCTVDCRHRAVVLPGEKQGAPQCPVSHRVAPVEIDAVTVGLQRFPYFPVDIGYGVEERPRVMREGKPCEGT